MATRAPSRTAKNTADMVRSLAVTLVGGALLFGTVFFVFYRDSHTDPIRAVDPSKLQVSLAQARDDLPTALLPTSVPKGWTVTSVSYRPADPSVPTGPTVLHLGYVTARTGPRDYVDLEAGSIEDALDAFDGAKPVATGASHGDLVWFKAADGTLTLRTAQGVAPATGLTGTKNAAELEVLASVLRRGGR